MKKLILFELILLFLATTFMTDTQGWYQVPLPRSDVFVQDIFFIDSLDGWVLARKNTNDTAIIYSTTDGGVNWINQFQDKVYLFAINFPDANTGYCVGYYSTTTGGSGLVKKTTNGGISWYTVSFTVAEPLVDVKFVNKDTGWIASNDSFDGGIFKSTNGGISWQQELNQSYAPTRIFFLNRDTGWAACQQTKLYRTTNGGGNWNQQYNFPSSLIDIIFISTDTGFATTAIIYKTTDGGSSWQQYSGSEMGGEFSFATSNTGWAGNDFNRVTKTSNCGISWFYQSSPIFYNLSVNAVDSLNAWAGESGVVHTTDGGGPPVAVEPISNEIPAEYKLYQNYPNPFNTSSKFKIQITKLSNVQVRVYDITGRTVGELINQRLAAGEYETEFNGNNYSSGVYFYSLIVNDQPIDTKKMILLK